MAAPRGKLVRLDALMVAQGLAPSREKAKELIEAGRVRVAGRAMVKPSTLVSELARVEVAVGGRLPVSRGYLKLAHALDRFGLSVEGKRCLDVGISTGGFTECLLDRGAAHVVGVDVGRGQVDARLAGDPRVTVLEGVNARYLTPDMLPYRPEVVTVDVSFISVRKVVPALENAAAPGAAFVVLVKPQFEAGRGNAPKGVVRDPAVHEAVLRDLRDFLRARGLRVEATYSPIRGARGNIEFFFLARPGDGGPGDDEVAELVREAWAELARGVGA